MRALTLSLFVTAAVVSALAARDAPEERRPVRRANDPEYRDRLKQYVAAFRRMSPEGQERVRLLDKQLQEEDPATRERLHAMMERYALWLSRLNESDRQRIQAVPAGSERLRIVREVLDKQWLENLPAGRRETLAKLSETDRTKTINRWRDAERDREKDRLDALRTAEVMAIPGQAERIRQLREEITKFAKNDLEPKLNPRERNRLQTLAGKGAVTYNYLHQVLILSEAKGLKPPGPPEFWNAYREPRRPAKLADS